MEMRKGLMGRRDRTSQRKRGINGHGPWGRERFGEGWVGGQAGNVVWDDPLKTVLSNRDFI